MPRKPKNEDLPHIANAFLLEDKTYKNNLINYENQLAAIEFFEPDSQNLPNGEEDPYVKQAHKLLTKYKARLKRRAAVVLKSPEKLKEKKTVISANVPVRFREALLRDFERVQLGIEALLHCYEKDKEVNSLVKQMHQTLLKDRNLAKYAYRKGKNLQEVIKDFELRDADVPLYSLSEKYDDDQLEKDLFS